MISKIASENILYTAWQNVEENHGCMGSDGVTIKMYNRHLEDNLHSLADDLLAGRYQPFPLIRFPVPKRNKKGNRYLAVPTIRDRVAQTAACEVTRGIFEAEFEDVSHAYRRGRGVQTAVRAIAALRDQGYKYAMDADIEAYFDNVSHDLLFEKLVKLFPDQPKLLRLFNKWIKTESYDGSWINISDKGIPQGSVISPFFANLFLDELDEFFIEHGYKLVRYADDFVVLSRTRAEAEEIAELTDMLLDDMKLDLNMEKTKIVSFEGGFKFLGALFLNDTIYLPFPEKKTKRAAVKLPPPLTLKKYLELKNAEY